MLARLAFFVLLITPPIALAADAPPSAGKITVVQPPPKAAAAPASKSTPPPPVAAASIPLDASACRMDCAKSYYFCRAGENPDGCSPNWSQCVAACSSPDLAPQLPPPS